MKDYGQKANAHGIHIPIVLNSRHKQELYI